MGDLLLQLGRLDPLSLACLIGLMAVLILGVLMVVIFPRVMWSAIQVLSEMSVAMRELVNQLRENHKSDRDFAENVKKDVLAHQVVIYKKLEEMHTDFLSDSPKRKNHRPQPGEVT